MTYFLICPVLGGMNLFSDMIADRHEEVIDTAGRSIDLSSNHNIPSNIDKGEED